MSLRSVCPVILCSGRDQNFWPVSSDALPQQFAKTGDAPSAFQQSLKAAFELGLGPAVVVALSDHRHLVDDQIAEYGIPVRAVVGLPEDRGTSAAACAATEIVAAENPDTSMLLMLADRQVIQQRSIADAISAGCHLSDSGQFVSFGFPPGAGVPRSIAIELAQGTSLSTSPQPVAQFLPTSDTAVAGEIAATGRYMWGMQLVLVAAKTLRGIYGRHAAPIRATVRRAVREGQVNGKSHTLGACYSAADETSFFTSIMQHQQGTVVPLASGSSTVGNWREAWQSAEKDRKGVRVDGNAQAHGCNDTYLASQSDGMQVLGIGLSNIAVVATRDAVLVMDMDKTEELPTVVRQMEARPSSKSQGPVLQLHPWGRTEMLQTGPTHRLRWVIIKPGCRIPTRSHLNRKENWVVVEGTGRVVRSGVTELICENDSVLIEKGQEYSIENPGKATLKLVEVQTGPYLGDDDQEVLDTVYETADAEE